MIEQKIEELVAESLEANAFTDCFIYDLKVNANKIDVFLESDSSITFEKCRKVSRHIEAYLDEIEWKNGVYTIEVSSPGVGAPLKFPRQYVKNIGRTIEVKHGEDQKTKGLLMKADDTQIEVSYKDRVKEGKRKKTIEVVELIPIEEIKEAKIKITF